MSEEFPSKQTGKWEKNSGTLHHDTNRLKHMLPRVFTSTEWFLLSKGKKKVAVYHHTGSAGKICGIYSTCWSVFLTQIFAPLIDSFYFQAFVVEFMGTYKHAPLGSHWNSELSLFLKGRVTPGWQKKWVWASSATQPLPPQLLRVHEISAILRSQLSLGDNYNKTVFAKCSDFWNFKCTMDVIELLCVYPEI